MVESTTWNLSGSSRSLVTRHQKIYFVSWLFFFHFPSWLPWDNQLCPTTVQHHDSASPQAPDSGVGWPSNEQCHKCSKALLMWGCEKGVKTGLCTSEVVQTPGWRIALESQKHQRLTKGFHLNVTFFSFMQVFSFWKKLRVTLESNFSLYPFLLALSSLCTWENVQPV